MACHKINNDLFSWTLPRAPAGNFGADINYEETKRHNIRTLSSVRHGKRAELQRIRDAINRSVDFRVFSRRKCPHFHMINQVMTDELRAAGLNRDDVQSTEYNTIAEASFNDAKGKYTSNPSAFCDATWHLYGSSGTYPRQLLELN